MQQALLQVDVALAQGDDLTLAEGSVEGDGRARGIVVVLRLFRLLVP
jgi:hypothetical protein